MTKVYIDENLAPQIAEALNILETHANEGFEVLSIGRTFGRGAQDEDWIPKVGAEQGVVITSDYNIQRIKRQRELYEKHGVGIFFRSGGPVQSAFKIRLHVLGTGRADCKALARH